MPLAWLWLLMLVYATDGSAVTPTQSPELGRRNEARELERRATTTSQLITCGYLDGNANSPRSAQPGFDCRVDTQHGIWGFCPTTVISATDCGLAAACKDSGTCSSICRLNPDTSLTTFTCQSLGTNVNYCSTAILTFGVDQSYGYIACGASPETQNYLVSPTFTSPTITSAKSSSTSSTVLPSSNTSTSQRIAVATSGPVFSAPPQTSSSSASSTDGSNTWNTSSSNVGAIVGGILGGLALVCVSVVAAIYIVKQNRSDKANLELSPSSAPQPMSAQPNTTLPPSSLQGLHEADSSYRKTTYSYERPVYPTYSGHVVELPSNPHD